MTKVSARMGPARVATSIKRLSAALGGPHPRALTAAEHAERLVGMSDSDRRSEHVRALSSIASGRLRRHDVLARPCAEHEAGAGDYCFGDGRSGVRGFCQSRWNRTMPSATTRIVGGTRSAR
jgi:hypothetical protein